MSLTLNDITKKTTQLIAEGDDGVMGSLLDLIYPIGSIYMNVNDTCPSLFLGGVISGIALYLKMPLDITN